MSSVLGRVQRLRHELKFRDLEVVRVQDVTPHLRAVTFTDESLADFVSPSFDDHIKLFIDTGSEEPARRDYTPRHVDNARRELTLEFVLHGDGPASEWASQAAPGQRVRIGGPRGSFLIPLDYAWHLLVGDETALPAIARRLEELPAGARTIVVLEIADEADRPKLATSADVHWHWTSDSEQTLSVLRGMALPAGEGYVWAAGEAAEMAEVRRILVDEKGHDKRAIRAAAYWKRGATAHHESIEA